MVKLVPVDDEVGSFSLSRMGRQGKAGPIGPFPGMIAQGNIDLAHRPVVQNPDGSISTVRSMSFGTDNGEVLVPTVSPDGRIMSDDEAMQLYGNTGQTLGVFDTPEHADMYAKALHQAQARFYQPPKRTPSVDPATNQPPGVPAFVPQGVEGYNPQTGEVTRQYSPAGSAAMGAADSTTLGFGDELASVLGSVLTGVPRQQVLSEMRGDANAAQAQNPGSYLAGQIGGGLAQAVGTGGAGLGTAAARGGASLGKVAAGSALDGALYGGAYGAGSADEGNRLTGAGLGALAGGAVGGLAPLAVSGLSTAARRAVTPFAVSPERQAAIATLTQEGVPLTAGQKTGSKAIRFAESEIGGGKAADMMERQAEAFTSAAMRKAGGAGRATSDNMAALSDRLGREFQSISARNTLQADGQFLQDFVGTLQEYNKVLPSEQRQILGNIAKDIGARIKAGGGKMSGAEYQSIRSRLTKRAVNSGKDGELAAAYRGMRDALDSAMDRSIKPADAGKWAELRRQYGNMKTLENAIAGAGGEDAGLGLITPARLRMAASSGKRGQYARGQSDFADLAKAGQALMTPLPNSATAARNAVRNLGIPIGSAGIGAAVANIPGALAGALAPYVAGRALMSAPVQRYLANQAVQSTGNPFRDALIASFLRGGTVPAIEGR